MDNLREEILEEAHFAAYSVHPGATKMYHSIRDLYWWDGLKKDVADYVAKCLTCQQVKARTSEAFGVIATVTHSRVEMGHDCHEFCEWFTSYVKWL